MIMVSACLLGENCKYHGGNNLDPHLVSLLKGSSILPVCPEMLGGLPAPRSPAEIIWQRDPDHPAGRPVITTKNGEDLTAPFLAGAAQVVELAKQHQIRLVIFKERSPSCGVEKIYDGTFSSRLIPGCGVCTALLRQTGCQVISEESPDLAQLIQRAADPSELNG